MYQQTAQYTLKKLDLITNQNRRISIIDNIQSIVIVEDLFRNHLHGSISIVDGNDLHQTAPIIGEEIIEFVYNIDNITDSDINLKFRVFRLETSTADAPNLIAHKLHIVSLEAFYDVNSTLSKSYKNKSIEFIVNDAFKQISSKKISFGGFAGNYHIVSPNWSPLQLINYTTSIARPRNYKGSMVVFYETLRGFQYRHIEELLSTESLGEWSAKSLGSDNEINKQDQIKDVNTIIEFRILKNSSDVLKSSMEGFYANAVLGYDNISKTFKVNQYDYLDKFKDTVHLNSYKMASNNLEYSQNQMLTYVPSTNLRNSSKYYKTKMGNTNTSDRKEEVIPWRNSMLSQILGTQMEIVVSGDSRLSVGKVIDVRLPNNISIESMKLEKHRYNTKKVLITKITHAFTASEYRMSMIINSDSYPSNINSLDAFKKASA